MITWRCSTCGFVLPNSTHAAARDHINTQCAGAIYYYVDDVRFIEPDPMPEEPVDPGMIRPRQVVDLVSTAPASAVGKKDEVFSVVANGRRFEVCGPLFASLLVAADYIANADTGEVIKDRTYAGPPRLEF